MPIYKGATKVTPKPGGKALSRVYRGSTLVWQAAPAYPISGTWGGGTMPTGYSLCDSHTITQAGTYTITWSVDFPTVTHNSLPGAKFRVNDAGLWTSGSYRAFPGNSTATGTRTLNAGDVIDFYVETEAEGAVASGGTWSIEKLD